VHRLESLLGRGRVWVGPEIPEKYLTDKTGEIGEPGGMVQPSTVEEVVALLRVAQEEKIVVAPRGGGSGLRGGAVPFPGGLVLSLEKLNKIVDLDKVNYIAKVQPGVLTVDLQKAAWEKGLYYPIDSLSSEISTLGGDVAENAHGLRGVRYGELRDYLRRLDFVLPTGEMAHTGADPMKSVSGYDMNKVFIGSRGTLGVFTEITLKLLPRPETARALVAGFQHLREAAATASALIANLLTPSALELMDQNFVRFLHEKSDLSIDGNALLLLEADGFESSVRHQIQVLRNICQNHKALEVLKDLSEEEERRLWEVRKLWAFRTLLETPPVLFVNLFVPPADLEGAVEGLETLLNQIPFPTTLFGHAGEGNLHVALFPAPGRDFTPEVLSARRQILEVMRKVGGLYAHEYFIGMPSLSPTPFQGGASGLREVFSQFKKKVDPNNILNPGKVLT